MAKYRDLVITRVFEAPRATLWKAWTDAELLRCWWGPKEFTTPVFKVDLRVGGKYHYCMRSPEGQDVWATGVYREIVPQKRLVFTDSFADEKGNVVSGESYGMDADFPLELLITVDFADQGNKTKLTLTHAGMPDTEEGGMAEEGWNMSLDKLAEVLVPEAVC